MKNKLNWEKLNLNGNFWKFLWWIFRFIEETKGLIGGIQVKGMDKDDYEKIKEVYSIVVEDMQKWSEQLDFEKEINIPEFIRSEGKVTLGHLQTISEK